MSWFAVALIALFVAGLFFTCHWLQCRLAAEACPRCGSELTGEWGVEMWRCRACGHYWETPYREGP